MALARLNLGARWGHAINATPRPLCLRERAQYPLYRRLYGLRGRSGQVWKREALPHRGFELRTVEPIAFRYTDYIIPACNS